MPDVVKSCEAPAATSALSKVVLQKDVESVYWLYRALALHSGKKVSMSLNPAAADTGIIFHRTDLEGDDRIIPARWDFVVDTRMATTIGNQAGACVSTIEHLMAALAGCGIDNAVIEIDGAEVSCYGRQRSSLHLFGRMRWYDRTERPSQSDQNRETY